MRNADSLMSKIAMGGMAAIVLVGGTAEAATGGSFLLGRSNTAGATTTLTNSAGTALRLNSPAGRAPLSVSNTTQIPGLNASYVGGKTAAQLQGATGPQGPIGQTGPQGPAGPSARRQIITSAYGNIGGFAACPLGYQVVGGGYKSNSGDIVSSYVTDSFPSYNIVDGEGWDVTTSPPSGKVASGTVYAICLSTS